MQHGSAIIINFLALGEVRYFNPTTIGSFFNQKLANKQPALYPGTFFERHLLLRLCSTDCKARRNGEDTKIMFSQRTA